MELYPKIGGMWMRRGEQVKIITPGRNKRINVFITLLYPLREIKWNVFERRRSREFIRHIRELIYLIKKKGMKEIVLIMDNASQHKSKETEEFIKRRREIKPLFLPKYAPQLNEVEKINRKIKREINTNSSYKNKKELTDVTRAYLRRLSILYKWDLT